MISRHWRRSSKASKHKNTDLEVLKAAIRAQLGKLVIFGILTRLTRILLDQGMLQTIRSSSGRRPATYRFEPLVKLVRV